VSDRSAIEWTDATWNPWRGCDKVSPGCAHCYMFAGQRQYGRDPSVVVRAADATFLKPLSRKWRAEAADIAQREQRRMRVFTCSWSDWFHETADPWREEAWDIVRQAEESYDFQILTKRPERILDHLPPDWGDGWPHVWLGVSIENRRFVHRAVQLGEVPAAVRFVSAEPLLGPIADELDLRPIDWLIVGGESGPRHRRMDPAWARDLRDDCRWDETAFFFKQWGGTRPGGDARLDGEEHREFPRSEAFVGQGSLL
jgi:protein gp37